MREGIVKLDLTFCEVLCAWFLPQILPLSTRALRRSAEAVKAGFAVEQWTLEELLTAA
jgi:hypothetical protein